MSHAEDRSDLPMLFACGIGGKSAKDEVRLDGEEIRHLRALRLSAGDRVRVTDGRGTMWIARLGVVGSGAATCTLEGSAACLPVLGITLAFGVANRTHTLWLVEKATEIGVRRLQPVEFARSRSVADAARSRSFWSKAERRAVAALKQCGGGWLPEICSPVDLNTLLSRFAAPKPDQEPEPPAAKSLCVLLDRTGVPLGEVLAGWDGEAPLMIVVGPEGGLLTQEARELADAGFAPARLGRTVLRFETAAIAGAAVAAQRVEMMRDAGGAAAGMSDNTGE